jgi:endonuclease III
MGKHNTQDAIKSTDLQEALTYAVTEQVADEKSAKRIKRVAKQTTNVTDVVAIVKAMTSHQDQYITQLIDKVQIHERVLTKLGATPEMIQEATKEYYGELQAKREELLAAQEQLQEVEEATEDNEQ